MRETRKIIIADHHPLGAAALAASAREVDEKLEIQSVNNLAALRDALGSGAFSLAVFNLSLCETDGTQALGELRSRFPAVPLLALDGEAGPELVARLRTLGIKGILAAAATIDELAEVLSTLLKGGEWFPAASQLSGRERRSAPINRLSPAQMRVLTELAEGKANRAIAEALCLSEATIKSHLYAIYKELGVKNRTQALLKIQQG